jgi:hypothetical protein
MEAAQGQGAIEAVTMSEILGLDTWNQTRSSEQLQSFIERRHAVIGEVDLEE